MSELSKMSHFKDTAMQSQVYQNRNGSYDVINSHGILFHIDGKIRKKIGKAGNWKSTGTLLKNIPVSIRPMFFEIQTHKE